MAKFKATTYDRDLATIIMWKHMLHNFRFRFPPPQNNMKSRKKRNYREDENAKHKWNITPVFALEPLSAGLVNHK